MDFSTYLPILLLLGVALLPELSSSKRAECACTCNSCTSESKLCGCGCEKGAEVMPSCHTSVTQCNNMCVNISGVRFKNSPEELCPCEIMELQSLADNGYETWRLDPVATAARFSKNCFIDQCFRQSPVYLAGTCRTCDRTYVVLGAGCCGKMIFELCQPAKQGEGGIWKVTRYGKYSDC